MSQYTTVKNIYNNNNSNNNNNNNNNNNKDFFQEATRLTYQSSKRASHERKHVTLTDKRMYMCTYKSVKNKVLQAL